MRKARYTFLIRPALGWLLLSAAGCGRPEPPAPPLPGPAAAVRLNAADSGKPVVLKPGQSFELVLDSNASTGYSWQVEPSCDAKVLALAGRSARANSAKPMPGSGETETWRFVARGPGETELVLVYRRPWEKDVQPVREFRARVTVAK